MNNTTSETQILQSFSDALVSMVGRVSSSIVHVSSARGRGTGIVWDKQGHVVSASHVIGRATRIEVVLGSGERLGATVVGQDRFSDLAVLKIQDPGKLVPAER